jgi:hypothetical protein
MFLNAEFERGRRREIRTIDSQTQAKASGGTNLRIRAEATGFGGTKVWSFF